MRIANFTPCAARTGGILVGLAASILLILRGNIFGISGIVGGLLNFQSKDILWRFLSILGLITGAFLIHFFFNTPNKVETVSTTRLVIAGLLVGFGTRLGNGCTSGHGVCGISRLSIRSLVATACFMLSAIITVYFLPYSV